jgi:hypothetical protein
MKKRFRLIVIIISYFSFLISHSSCTQDAYEKGEGKYSLMRADFVEAHANAQKQINQITTDDGEQLQASQPFSAKLVVTPDSVYRCILYYNKVRDEKGQYVFEPISIGEVPCPKITPLLELDKEMKTDPVKFESAWLSRSGKYLNLSLYLMTGTTDDEKASQTLHIIQDTIVTHLDASRTSHLRLYHDQAGIPEYYSTQVYASILTQEIPADSVHLTINTYKGPITKVFSLR